MQFRPDSPPIFLSTRSSRWFITTCIAVAIFTDIFLYAVIVPVVPFALNARAHVDQDRVQYWVSILVAVYGAACLVASPFCGWFADRTTSRRFPLLLGLLALTGATVMLHVGSSVPVMIAGRILQGISAAVVWTVGLALLVDTAKAQNVAQYMGYVSLAMSLGILVAPLLGGIVFSRAGYNAVFAMQYGLIGVDVVFRFLLIERRFADKWETPETAGKGIETADRPISAISQASEKKNDDPITPIPKNTSSQTPNKAMDANVLGEEHETSDSPASHLPPMISLLASRRLLTGLWDVMVIAALMTSFDAVLPLFVKKTFGWTSLGAGLVYLPIVIPSFLSPLVGWASDRYGPRWLATAGFLTAAPWLILLRLVDHNSIGQKVLLCTMLALFGFSLDLVFPPVMAEISSVVEAKEASAKRRGMGSPFGKGGAYAQAYALFNTAFAAGAMIGPFWAGFVVENAGWGTMAWSLGLLSAISAVPTFIWAGGSVRKVWRRRRQNTNQEAVA
ncbi:MFS general substrate transporter [Rhizodiscina lignyota]|uniref:MFS general substrate transporter n=1 Tax=Rhizodiscina lignyota TaxID=1504668 RepID=A0A9P4I5A5_9PEZI|nr:MFS general substrate transporter [Rhizodiscina lignyota]